jgi:hypothetical protein
MFKNVHMRLASVSDPNVKKYLGGWKWERAADNFVEINSSS